MLNRIDARLRSPAHAFRAVCMRGHTPAKPVCVCNNGLHLLQGILRGVRVIALRQHAAGGANLDHVRAVLDDFANLVLHSLDAVRHSISMKVQRGRQQVFVAMAAGDSERRPRRDDPRPDDVAIIDRIAQRDVRIIFRAKVSHRCKTCFEGPPCVPRAMQRFACRRNRQPLVPERVQVECQVRMHVDQAGQQRGVLQINRRVSRTRCYFAGRRDLRNLVAFNHDGLVGAQFPSAHVEHAPRANHRPLRRLRACCDRHASQGGQNRRAGHSPSADFSPRS